MKDNCIRLKWLESYFIQILKALGQCITPPRQVLPCSVAMRIRIQIHIRIRDLDRCQNLISCSLAHCQHSLKLPSKSVRTFLHKVANREKDRQRRKHNLLGGGKDVDLYFSVNLRTYYIYRPFEHFSGPGRAICRVCVCLCVTVKTITSELNELWPSYLPFGTPVQQVSPVESIW